MHVLYEALTGISIFHIPLAKASCHLFSLAPQGGAEDPLSGRWKVRIVGDERLSFLFL